METRSHSFLLAVLVAGSALGEPSKVARDLGPDSPGAAVDVIVQFHRTPGEAEQNRIRARGGAVRAELRAVKGVRVSLPARAVNSLAADPDVFYMSPDRDVNASPDYAAEAVSAGPAYQAGWNGTGAAAGAPTTVDQYGHGTHAAGNPGGNGIPSTGSGFFRTFRGVATNVNIVNLRVPNPRGSGNDGNVIGAIQGAIEGGTAVWGGFAVWGATNKSTAETLNLLIEGEN